LEQAKERLWTDTVLPLLNEFLESFGSWLLKGYGDNLTLKYNFDSIPALEGLRAKRFTRMMDAIGKGALTINESRDAIGYAPMTGGDELLIPSSLIPLGLDLGFTDVALKGYGLSDIEIKELKAELNVKVGG
jgi:phage portal protein BeeE